MSTLNMPSRTSAAEGNGAPAKSNGWHRLCEELLAEREQLLARIALLTNENKQLKKSICHLMHEDIPFNKEEVLANFGSEPTLEDLIRELEEAEA